MASFYLCLFGGTADRLLCDNRSPRYILKMMVERIIDLHNSRGRGCIDYEKDTKCRGAKGVFISLENGNLNNEKKKTGGPLQYRIYISTNGSEKIDIHSTRHTSCPNMLFLFFSTRCVVYTKQTDFFFFISSFFFFLLSLSVPLGQKY